MTSDGGNLTRLMLVDDHPLLRRGLRQLFADEADFEVVAEAGTGGEAVRAAQEQQPDLILLDLHMKEMSGLDTLDALRAAGVEARIVILTVSDQRDEVVAAFRRGADGYLLKDMEPEELVERIKQAAAGETVVSEQLSGVLATALRAPEQNDDLIARLTEREAAILRQIARGQSNKVIARHLDIAEGTVKVHVKNLLKKMNMRSRVEAAVWAVGHGLK